MNPTPEEKCSHEWIQKTGLGYHCRKCRNSKIRPSPSPEARVDWEKEAKELFESLVIWTVNQDPKEVRERSLELIAHALSAAYEAGILSTNKQGE
jgi:hypothetical protein